MDRCNTRAGFEMDGPYHRPLRERLQTLLTLALCWFRK